MHNCIQFTISHPNFVFSLYVVTHSATVSYEARVKPQFLLFASLWDLMRWVTSRLIKGRSSHYPGRNHTLQREFSKIIDNELRLPAGGIQDKHSCACPLPRTSTEKSSSAGNYTTAVPRGPVHKRGRQ